MTARHKMSNLTPSRITAFAAIDAAMLKVIKASKELDNAQYSRSEGVARDSLIRAAHNLRKVFLDKQKEINDEYARNEHGFTGIA